MNKVGIVMGSRSDLPTVEKAVDVLRSDANSRVIVARNGRFEDMNIEEALTMERTLDQEMYDACFRINTSYPKIRH